MTRHLRRSLVAALSAAAFPLAACSDSTDPGPQPPGDVTVTATGSTTARLSFTGRSGDQYTIQRAAGSGSVDFSAVATVDGPSAGTAVTYDDAKDRKSVV